MLDVAAVAETLLEREPPATHECFAAQFGLPESVFFPACRRAGGVARFRQGHSRFPGQVAGGAGA
ncbi:hypothetical protein ACFS3C_08340 [Azotobacter vinelandii]